MSLPTPAPLSHGAARAQQMKDRILSKRTVTANAHDADVRQTVQTASARAIVTQNLGKKEGPTRGTSIARIIKPLGNGIQNPTSGSALHIGLALPPSLPKRKF